MAGLAGLALAASLAGCSTGPSGGGDLLPGPVPSGAVFTSQGDVPAPPFSGKLLDGTEIELADLWKDRPVVLQFMASWCTQCAEAEETLASLRETYGDAITVLEVSTDENADDVRAYLRDNDVDVPAIIDVDGSIWRSYAVSEPPATAVIDTKGHVVKLWAGGASADQLEDTLSSMITLPSSAD